MLKKCSLVMLLFSNFVLPMGNDSAQVIENNGMSKTKKVMIGCGIGVVVIGGAIVLGPVVLPTATIASIKAACAAATTQVTAVGVSAKAAVASAASHSGAASMYKVCAGILGMGGAGTVAVKKHTAPGKKNDDLIETNNPENTIREIKTTASSNTNSRIGLCDIIAAAQFAGDVTKGAGDGLIAAHDYIEKRQVKSDQEKELEELEKEKKQRQSLAESIAQAY